MRPVVLALATIRLTQLVTDDELTEPIRDKTDEWAKKAGYGSLPDRLSYLVSCQRCVSVWAAAAVLVGSRLRVARPLVYTLAVSQAALYTITVADRVQSS